MTPERQMWWDSLPKEEKRIRLLIKTLKGNIICCKQSISDELNAINADKEVGKNQLEAVKANLRDTKRTIKFLRKQIAMKPIVFKYPGYKSYECPRCREGAITYLPHCSICGQKLRWE